MTNSNSFSSNETKNLIPTCLILKKHDYKWGTIGGNNEELSRSHWHIWTVANLFANWIDMGDVSDFGWLMEYVKCTAWHDSLYFLCLYVVPICKILASFQCTWWPFHKPDGPAYISCAVYEIIRRNTADQEAQIPSRNIVPINSIFVPGN